MATLWRRRGRWAILVALVVVGIIVVWMSWPTKVRDTHFGASATTASFVHQGNTLCAPLVRLESPQLSERQLLVARTLIEELAQVRVPPATLARENVLLGTLATYAQDFEAALGSRGGGAGLNQSKKTANQEFQSLGLTSCVLKAP